MSEQEHPAHPPSPPQDNRPHVPHENDPAQAVAQVQDPQPLKEEEGHAPDNNNNNDIIGHSHSDEQTAVTADHDDDSNQNNNSHHHHHQLEDKTNSNNPKPASRRRAPPSKNDDDNDNNSNMDHHCDDDDGGDLLEEFKDAEALAQEELVMRSTPSTELEVALVKILERKQALIDRISGEITKLKSFVQKRKQTYKRKRKEDGAPTRALSAYNMFIKERFAQLAKENEEALKSDDANATLKRVPPANLVAKTGNEWKELPEEIKAKYEEKAKEDRKRYEEQMAQYQPPDKQANRKRNKTGYNMFFSSHVLRLKQTESGVPSERGSVARLVGTAWKQLSNDEKLYYEREADKHNGMNPVKDTEEEEEEEEMKTPHMDHHYAYPVHPEMHMPPPPPMHAMPQHPGAPDPRAHHYYPPPPPHHMYGPPPPNAYGHYDYSQHHQRHPQHGRQPAPYPYHY